MSNQRTVPLLTDMEVGSLNPSLANPIEYRKSGLSLNHVIGCPLDCAYCVRHLFDNFYMKAPRALMSDEAAVRLLLAHKFFTAHVTPIQIFNRATDPMLEPVRPHLLATIREIDKQGLSNHVLVITRWKVSEEVCAQLNEFKNIKLTILVTYSGIQDETEPVDSKIALQSLKTLNSHAKNYRTILYWRPLIPGLNDTEKHLVGAAEAAKDAHAVVFSGLFYRSQIASHYRSNGYSEPYEVTARRKILPLSLEKRILNAFRVAGVATPIFRKTSCGVSYVHKLPDYNGHIGVKEICDICPRGQIKMCNSARRKPLQEDVENIANKIGVSGPFKIDDRAITAIGLDESQRYYLQHALEYQVHDQNKPHYFGRHGRAEIGWNEQIGNPPLANQKKPHAP